MDAVNGVILIDRWRSRRELCQFSIQCSDLSPILFVGVALGVRIFERTIDHNMPLLATMKTSSLTC